METKTSKWSQSPYMSSDKNDTWHVKGDHAKNKPKGNAGDCMTRSTHRRAFPEEQSHRKHRITKDASPISVRSSTLKTVILYENERITAEPYYRWKRQLRLGIETVHRMKLRITLCRWPIEVHKNENGDITNNKKAKTPEQAVYTPRT